ncbi:MAG: tRNA 2-thiouridine(34) synthase MnmA [Chloroflexota bacterium]|nr:tRNA 2-thiouridine(34) synthase MnmA [Chloroflexota bacterium]MDE2884074.1 tRNA 2-thiouridine(34) synthase MnmA [Chloroflexota bacterium]
MESGKGTAPQGKRVVVAMSGGVDSSVAAYLLHGQGYDVIGVTMRLWSTDEDDISPDHQGCCSIQDIEDARRVCQTLGVPHYVVDARREFREHVVAYFVSEYERGRTPHPCIACNDRIKFDFLMQRAAMMDADLVATGHYARIERDDAGEAWVLRQGVDAAKDQSYVLFGLRQEQLGRVVLPVGAHTKEEIRELAREAGFHLAGKADSQEICFIPSGDYRRFMQKESAPEPGEVVDATGRVVGEHPGIEFYTVGQRRGIGVAPSALGLPEGEKVFVTAVDPDSRRITVGGSRDLMRHRVRVGDVRYVAGSRPSEAYRVSARIRYNGRAAPAVLHHDDQGAVLWFDEPQRAITPGQAAVFYDGDRVLGGGFIEGPADAGLPSLVEQDGRAGAPAAV